MAGSIDCLIRIAPDRVYTDRICYQIPGGLLPRLFTFAFLPLFSVALSLKLPSADVIRYRRPLEPGLSSDSAFRRLPATAPSAGKRMTVTLPHSENRGKL